MDVEQTIKFILDQQQRLGTHLERLDAHMERLTEDHRRLEGYVERIARNQLELAEMQSRHRPAEGPIHR